ncbi:potassium channel subfamily K member 16-like [Asterias rubens]|uniref:potassium channel subfamily K member 16-like n=1 Tax=Asterias rubens TaxID=7604 RepID=UPI0014556431|nr:potassium channel subfamily K member 16-like [Asterias rubens]
MKPWVKSLVLLPVFLGYIFIGSSFFLKIEGPHQVTVRDEYFDFLRLFVQNNSACGMSVDDLKAILTHVNVAKAEGLLHPETILNEGVSNVWTMPNSIVFASTIVTTIGYGRLVPRTVGGQVFCIIYAIFGIPMCYFMLSVVGDTFQSLWHHSKRLFDKSLICIQAKKSRLVIGGLVTCIVIWTVTIALPSLVFVATEHWNFGHALYFSFISMSTIGFGDFTFGIEQSKPLTTQQDWIYKLGILLYFLIGLSVISIVYRGVWRAQRARLKRAGATTRRFLQRGGRYGSYSLGAHPEVSSSVGSGVQLKTSNDLAVIHENSEEEDHMNAAMAMDAMETNRRRSSVFTMSYTQVMGLNLANYDSGHWSNNDSLIEEETNATVSEHEF